MNILDECANAGFLHTKRKELQCMSQYLQGFADSEKIPRLARAAELLWDASNHVCAQGYYGCCGGETCTADHK